jgi:hypothetical protein
MKIPIIRRRIRSGFRRFKNHFGTKWLVTADMYSTTDTRSGFSRPGSVSLVSTKVDARRYSTQSRSYSNKGYSYWLHSITKNKGK